MITQKQDNKILPEELVQSTVEEQKTPQSAHKYAKEYTSKVTMLVIGSCVLLLEGAINPLLSNALMGDTVTNMWLWISIGNLFVLIAAFVLSLMARSNWTLLSFPVAILVGLIAGAMLIPNEVGFLLPAWAFNFCMLLFPIAAFTGSAIGTLIGKELKERHAK